MSSRNVSFAETMMDRGEKPALEDYFNIRCSGLEHYTENEVDAVWFFKRPEHGETISRVVWGHAPEDMDDETLCDVVGCYYSYGGPGRWFNSQPSVRRHKWSFLIYWSGGLDI